MPNLNTVLTQIQQAAHQGDHNAGDTIRRDYLAKLHEKTGRNIIAYYSGYLSKPNSGGTEINDEDKNGFMSAIHGLDRSKGLDLLLHTPGGDIASTQSIVDYLHKMFKNDIRAFIPQIAMSAGTMIACSCKEIWMGKQSNLGPIDPQLNGVPAQGVLTEFKTACKEAKDPYKAEMWGRIIAQYRPTFLLRCKDAIKWSNTFVENQLTTVMFKGHPNARALAKSIVKKLTHTPVNRTHSRHIHFDECLKMKLNVKPLESDQELQDLVLTVHHCYMHTFMTGPCYKAIENHAGTALFRNLRAVK
jgi:hypothetical protein